MRSFALFALIGASIFFLVSLGLTANSIADASQVVKNANRLQLIGDGQEQDPLPPAYSSYRSAVSTRGSGSSGNPSLSSIYASLSSARFSQTATRSPTTYSYSTITRPASASATNTYLSSINSANSAYSAYYSSLLASYSSYFDNFSDVYNSALYGGFTRRDAAAPTPVGAAAAAVVERAAVPHITAAPLVARKAPMLAKRITPTTSTSQLKSRFSAILAMFVLMLVVYIGLLVATILFVVAFRKADARFVDAHGAYQRGGPVPFQGLTDDVNAASNARTGIFSKALVVFAILTALLIVFGVVVFALLGAFIGIRGPETSAGVAFWVLSVLAAVAVCVALVLDKRTSERDGDVLANGTPYQYGQQSGVNGSQEAKLPYAQDLSSPATTEHQHQQQYSPATTEHPQQQYSPASPPPPLLQHAYYSAQQDIQQATPAEETTQPSSHYEHSSMPQPHPTGYDAVQQPQQQTYPTYTEQQQQPYPYPEEPPYPYSPSRPLPQVPITQQQQQM